LYHNPYTSPLYRYFRFYTPTWQKNPNLGSKM